MAKKSSRNTKARIVSAAWKLFYEQGYEETTVEEIIFESETSKGSFYHYFDGKDALLSSLSVLFDERYEELMQQPHDEMDCIELLCWLNQELFTTIENTVSIELLARLFSSQLVTKGEKHLLDRKPKALSGGQRQRVALGRAMVRNPAVFLLDEPLSNLDAKLRTSMRTEIIKLHQKLGTTFIYVTHDQTEAMTMGDRIVVMKDGLIQQVDTPQNLYDYPCNMFVGGFIGSPQMNFLDATLVKEGSNYYVDLGGDKLLIAPEKVTSALDAYVGKAIKAGIRPEDIKDDEEFMEKHKDATITAHVEVSELMGSEIYLYLEYKDYKMTARVNPGSSAKNGTDVKVAINTKKLHLFDPETELAILN